MDHEKKWTMYTQMGHAHQVLAYDALVVIIRSKYKMKLPFIALINDDKKKYLILNHGPNNIPLQTSLQGLIEDSC